MGAWLVKTSRDKRDPHEYSLETFGLAQIDIEREFANDRERFHLAASNPGEG